MSGKSKDEVIEIDNAELQGPPPSEVQIHCIFILDRLNFDDPRRVSTCIFLSKNPTLSILSPLIVFNAALRVSMISTSVPLIVKK